MKIAAIAAVVALVSLGASPLVLAARYECKPGVFLTIGGKIDKVTNPTDRTFEYSDAEFLKLPVSPITTATAWTEKRKFEGPTLSDVMASVGGKGVKLRVLALDAYVGEIPWSDLAQFQPILATTQDGVRLTRKNNGPLFVIYPRDKHSVALNTPAAQMRYVWQVCRIDVE
jgi:hypothetical protein